MKDLFEYKLIYLFLFIVQFSFGQLPSFSLNVISTNETCNGNGTLNFEATGTTTGATITYNIYLLPDQTNPIATIIENSLTGLNSGDYSVVATQVLGNLSNSQQQFIQINNQIEPLVFQLSSQPDSCNNGSITVDVINGNPISYEIISGPIIVPPQSSNTFLNLPFGIYNIRVNDICGDGIVQTYTVNQINDSNLSASIIETDQSCLLLTCDTKLLLISVQADQDTTINYPVTVTLEINPPNNGTQITLTQTLLTGDPIVQIFEFEIPFYQNQTFGIDVITINQCNQTSDDYIIVNHTSSFKIEKVSSSTCEESFVLYGFCNFLPPYFVNFIETPSAFNPVDFNPNNVGPFYNDSIVYSGNINNELPLGNYKIELYDTCGNSVINDFVIENNETDYELLRVSPCDDNQIILIPKFGVGITSVIIEQAPSELNLTLPFDASFMIVDNSFTMSLIPGIYTFSGINLCGETFSFQIISEGVELLVETTTGNLTGCSGNNGSILFVANLNLQSVIMTQAPFEFNEVLPYNCSEFIDMSVCNIINLPVGDYHFIITDVCGNILEVDTTVTYNLSNSPLVFFEKKGCEINYDSIYFISPNGPLTDFIITDAPSSFPFSMPYDVSFNIATNGFFCMNSLPSGTYNFYSKDICGVERNETRTLVGFSANDETQIIQNCGSFDIDLKYTHNYQELNFSKFWLQKFDSSLNEWVHPYTNVVYTSGTIPNNINSISLTNNQLNNNFAVTGNFRIINSFNIIQNGVYAITPCINEIKVFEYTGEISIDSVNNLPCPSGNQEIAINAQGILPIQYFITSKNGNAFYLDNVTSNVFSNLETAVYNFQLIDSCGNILNTIVDINTLPLPNIYANNICLNQNAQLSVPEYNNVNYQWWKDDNLTTVLSTSNILNFNPLTSMDNGVYTVRIYSSNSLSCVDFLLTFTINIIEPNAGLDNLITFCGNQGVINLQDYVRENNSNDGNWQEVSSSGMLNQSIWDSTNVLPGKYTFNYSVLGNCDSLDSAEIIIIILPIPETPIASIDVINCFNQNVNLYSTSVENAIYNWIGPNGFTSSEQNPIILNASYLNNGVYTVNTMLGDCVSQSSYVNLNINPLPDFEIESGCQGETFVLNVIPNSNSFQVNQVQYQWFGPNNFNSNVNPVTINGNKPGVYYVNVLFDNGCSLQKEININQTICGIPNIITPNQDGSNDNFNLIGFDVNKIKIYNRWGRLVFEKDNYLDEWFGQNSNGKLLPDSTYFYILYLKDNVEKMGWVLLKR